MTVAPSDLSAPSESHDGRFLATAGDTGSRVFDRATKQWSRLSEAGGAPQWSPDGRFLAFSRRDESGGGGFRVFVMPMDPKSGKAAGPARRVTIRYLAQTSYRMAGRGTCVVVTLPRSLRPVVGVPATASEQRDGVAI